MKYFISKFNSSMKKDIFGVDEEVKKCLRNIRGPEMSESFAIR